MSASAPYSLESRSAARSLPWSRVWLYGIGEIPVTATMVLLGLFLLFFYNSVMGMSAPLVGIATAAGLVLDAILDPFIGYRSDRSRHRLGRRRSFMLAGAATMGICFALLFCPPRSLGSAGLFLWLFACSMLFRFTTAVYRIPYLSLGAELSHDYDVRTMIMAVRAICGLAGALIAGGLSFLLFFRDAAAISDPKLNYGNYPAMGVAFGALLSIAGLIAFWSTSGHRDSTIPDLGARARGFLSGFRITMRNRDFRAVWLSFTLFYTAVVLNASLAVHFLTWCAGITDSAMFSVVETAFGIGAAGGVLLWMAVARRSEKRNSYILGMLGTALLLGAASLLIGPHKPLGVGHAGPLIAGYALAGIFASALWVLPPSMLADITDQDELATGSRREGIYFGVLNFGEKIASGAAVLLSGFLLHYFVQLAPATSMQTPSAVARLSLLYGTLPALLLLGSIVFIASYALDRATACGIQRQLALRLANTPS
jgi:glycoside/pentoside/hexuronide:cation symporter, GPH family